MNKQVPVCVAVFHSALKSASCLHSHVLLYSPISHFHTFIALLLPSLNYLFNPDTILRSWASTVLIFEAGKWSDEGA